MLKVLMLRKELDDKKTLLEALRAKNADFEKREAELKDAIAEAQTEDEKNVVRDSVNTYESEKKEHDQAITDLDEEVRNLETELDELFSQHEYFKHLLILLSACSSSQLSILRSGA